MAMEKFVHYTLIGENEELWKLFNIIKNIIKEQNKNRDWSDEKVWIEDIIKEVNGGIVPQSLQVYGNIYSIELNKAESNLKFHSGCKGENAIKAWDFIASKFNTIKVYFFASQYFCDSLKRDDENNTYYPQNYILFYTRPNSEVYRAYNYEYFISKEESFKYIEEIICKNSVRITTEEDIENLNEIWQENDCYIELHKIKSV